MLMPKYVLADDGKKEDTEGGKKEINDGAMYIPQDMINNILKEEFKHFTQE